MLKFTCAEVIFYGKRFFLGKIQQVQNCTDSCRSCYGHFIGGNFFSQKTIKDKFKRQLKFNKLPNKNDFIANDFIPSAETRYVKVDNGQYFQLKNATAELVK